MLNAFRDGMRERGYVEGQNLVIEYRAPGAASEQDVAADLMRGGYDVILAWTTPSVIAARRATSTRISGQTSCGMTSNIDAGRV